MEKIYKWFLHLYFSVRNSWPVFYYVLNRDARRKYSARTPQYTGVQARIRADLARDGIAFTTLEELFPGEGQLEKLRAYLGGLAQAKEHLRKKAFLLPFWDETAPIGMENPYFALSLRPEVLGIVNGYDRMWRRLNFLQLTETIPVGDSAPVRSQRWHRDPQEKRQVKMFIYVSDVDSTAGPFTYVKGSQFHGPKYGSLFPQNLPLGVYPGEGAVEKAANSGDIVSAEGAAGAVIFCDTAGLHRGGHAKSKSRFMFTAFYPSTRWTEPRFHSLTDSVARAPLPPEARYAANAA